MKLLTVIVPSFNMERYLEKCLKSLLVSDDLLPFVEVLVVNDGSTDSTGQIAHRFEARYQGVFNVIDKANGHYGSCVNAALKVAKGKYVKVLDADDYFVTDNFASYLRFLLDLEKTHETVDLIVNDFNVVDQEGNVAEEFSLPYPLGRVFGMRELADTEYELIMHGVAYRTENLRAINYHQTEGCVYTDSEWMFSPMLTVNKVVRFSKPLYMYLIGREGQSVSEASFRKNASVQFQILKGLFQTYQARFQDVSSDHVAYMKIYLVRLYRQVAGLYFRYASRRQFKQDFMPLHEEMRKTVPDVLKHPSIALNVFSKKWYGFDCYRVWKRSGMFGGLIVGFYRFYFAVRGMKNRMG